jgi:predicted nucleic acid-binding protein
VILVDTSIWVDHFRHGDATLTALLKGAQVLAHPFVIGELALGRPQQRHVALTLLPKLPKASVATDAEVLRLIDQHTLFGKGIGYVDVHLLAAARLTPGASLWTQDKRLSAAASRLALLWRSTR